jgi:hypothetical protein
VSLVDGDMQQFGCFRFGSLATPVIPGGGSYLRVAG